MMGYPESRADPQRGSAGKIDYRALVARFTANVARSAATPLAGVTAAFVDLFASSAILIVTIVGLMLAEGTIDITIVWVCAASLLLGAGLLLWSTRLYLPAVPLIVIVAVSVSIYLFYSLPYLAGSALMSGRRPARPPVYIALGLAPGLAGHVLLQRLEATGRQVAAILLSHLCLLRSRPTP